ncbi:hypothetical protein ACFUJR_34525 [Streptomyces sp. NPDC057271]|uniref:hypothetical protein n=1 Tax=unclassified Streptomyces TaxID=2593676 RepID=UPI003631B2A7
MSTAPEASEPKGPNDPITLNGDSGEIVVVPSQIKPYGMRLGDLSKEGMARTYSLEGETGGALGDGGDEASIALDAWYVQGRKDLIAGLKGLVEGVSAYSEGVEMMAQSATEAEDNAQTNMDALKKAIE